MSYETFYILKAKNGRGNFTLTDFQASVWKLSPRLCTMLFNDVRLNFQFYGTSNVQDYELMLKVVY
jgi:hypothetical protein